MGAVAEFGYSEAALDGCSGSVCWGQWQLLGTVRQHLLGVVAAFGYSEAAFSKCSGCVWIQ